MSALKNLGLAAARPNTINCSNPAAVAAAAAAATNAPAVTSPHLHLRPSDNIIFKGSVKIFLKTRAGLLAAEPKLGWLHYSS
jgi:hypothetical protein